MKKKIVIMGAAGRDFHNFNCAFRDNENYEVIAFTAFQIPNISDRKYPSALAGKLYPEGIPIYPEKNLTELIKKYQIDQVVFSYSDVSHEYVMHKTSIVNAAGADFVLLGTDKTMLKSKRKIISICAVRTGSGKSQVSRKVFRFLKNKGIKVAAIRHPMPYGDLEKQAVQRFASYKDFTKHECTIEEREEYEPYIEQGLVIYAGVDYEKILKEAEEESEIIVWDGGNNDTPFYKSDLNIVVVDPHRPGHELKYYPGETNFRMADVLIINKINTAKSDNVKLVKENIHQINPEAVVIRANSVVRIEDPNLIKDKKVLVVEDGPTLTHGGMAYGAGIVAAKKYQAKEIVDPRPYAVGTLKKTFEEFSHLTNLLPAMGYGEKQLKELEETINAVDCDAVVVGTPIDLERLLKINKLAVRVTYDIEEIGKPNLEDILEKFIEGGQNGS